MSTTSRLQEPVAVVSLGALFPGRGTTHGFWRDILEGVDALGPVPASHWLVEDYYDPDPRKADRTYGARGGFLKPVAFEPMAFGIPPAAIPATDTVQLLALMVAKAVLEEAEASSGGTVDRERTSVILGVASATELVGHMSGRLQRPVWENAARGAGLPEGQVQALVARMEAHYTGWSEATFPGMLGNVVAGRIANRLDLGGSNLVTDAACASSLAALSMALQELTLGDSDTVLVGGVDALNDILMYMCFSKTPALSPTGDCRPFSEAADGTMLGEGVGILALRRLADAERDGQAVHAVIRGLGGGSDGRATAIYAPLPAGQARTLRRAYERAGYDPRTVELMEAHGTGTKAGDAAEIEGLKRVFDPDERAGQSGAWCTLGSVKSQIGHTKAAAGAASLAKAVMALSHRVLPPTAKVDAPAKALAGSPFRVSTSPRPWVRGADHPRRASVSSFGFGGSNFHVTLEEYTGANRAGRVRAHPAELVLVSAADAAGLAQALEGLGEGLRVEGDLARLAEASHRRFEAGAGARAALVARDEAEAREGVARALRALAGLAPGGAVNLPGLSVSLAPARAGQGSGKVAFLFPGQGSQAVGMGAELAMAFPQALAAWDRAASHALTGPMRLHDLAFPPSAFSGQERAAQEAALTALEVAQPALAAASLACLGVLDRLGLKAEGAAGHSFGEVMALHVAGVIDADAALGVAYERARVMADAAKGNPGAMLAVQAGAGLLSARLAGTGVGVANDNASTQCVLSGPVEEIAALERQLSAEGLKVKRLPVASAFHSPIVAGAVGPFAQALEGVAMGRPGIPVWSNALARPYPLSAPAIRKTLARQIAEPVRFREMLEGMLEAGFDTFVEVGPGQVVSALVRQVAGERAMAVALEGKAGGLAGFLSGIGALCVAGHKLDVAGPYEGQRAPPEPVVPSRHAVMICGANYGRPYPPAEGAAGRHKPNPDIRPAVADAQPPVVAAVTDIPTPQKETETETMNMSDPQSRPDASVLARVHADLAQRHSEFLQVMSAAHQHYVSAVAGMMSGAGVAQAVAGQAVTESAPAMMPAARAEAVRPAPQTAPEPVRANGRASAAEPIRVEAPAVQAAPRPVVAAPVAPAKPAERALAAPVRPPGSDTARALVTAIVAEKTGYPEDMLDPDMDLEAELGVDSIKQVEILSTLRERMPDLPEISPERLGELRSIGSIAAFLGGAAPVKAQAARPVAVAAPAPAKAVAGKGGEAQRAAMTALVRSLIAEKTGYPEDMLEDGMDLESELGVDSIKQVEILSALREQRPDLPDLEPGRMAELRSIGKIASFFA